MRRLTVAELRTRGVRGHALEVRAWRLAQRVGNRGLSLEQLAGAVGCSVSTLGEIERGTRTASGVLKMRLGALIRGEIALSAAIWSGRRRARLRVVERDRPEQLTLFGVREPAPTGLPEAAARTWVDEDIDFGPVAAGAAE